MTTQESQPATQEVIKKNTKHKWYVGGIAASVASACTHPLDLLKVRIQIAKTYPVSGMKGGHTNLPAIFSSIFKNEGILGYYKGLSASIMRQLTFSSLRFNIYYVLKDKLKVDPKTNKVGIFQEILCATASGAAGACAGNVFDLLNIRMQSNGGLPMEMRRKYKNAFHGLWTLLKTEGPSALAIGLPTNISRAIVITIAQIVTYERSKHFLMDRGHKDFVTTHFLASLLSGFVTVTASNPLDVMKSLLMSSAPGKYKSGLDCARTVLLKQGPLYFMKGWLPAYVRVGPQTTITFIVLEQLKKMSFFQV